MKNLLKKIRTLIPVTKELSNHFNVHGIKNIFLFLDYIYCLKILHFSIKEYKAYNIFNNRKNRKDFLLIYHQQNFIKKVNPREYTRYKYKVYQQLQKYFKREVILIPDCGFEQFYMFLQNHKKVIIKPNGGSCARGIFIYNFEDVDKAKELFFSFEEQMVCEEYIKQAELFSQMHSESVNSIRVVSIYDNGEAKIQSASLKIGKGDSFVDNMTKGGLGANIDIDTGIIDTDGFDYAGNVFLKFPDTEIKIKGLQLPNFDKVLNTVKEAHIQFSDCPILGWDLAVLENDVCVIEVNNAPGPLLMQVFDKKPKGKNILKYIKEHEKSIKTYNN